MSSDMGVRLSVMSPGESRAARSHYRHGMAVTAKFVPERIGLASNAPSTLTLRLYNDDDVAREVSIAVSGDLSDHVRLDSSAVTVETNQIVDVLATVFAPSTLEAGTYAIRADVQVGGDTDSERSDGAEPAPATATVEVQPHADYTVALHPLQSRGARRGRHVVRATNTGNVVVTLDLAVGQDPPGSTTTSEPTAGATQRGGSVDAGLSVSVGSGSMTVAPGLTGEAAVRVEPVTTRWSGPTREHDFTVQSTSTEGRTDVLTGTFQQRPRVPNWLGPAAAGALAALLLGAVAWFTVLRPWTQDTADQAAADAIERDREALQERIADLEAAAAEAEELPLGTPIDIRLDVEPTGGNSEQATTAVEPGTILSITDVVFQNPNGAVGTVSLLRDSEVILRSELANFRDFDLHFVAPYQFDENAEIVLDVECRTPGAGASTCPVGVSLVGFVDEAD